MIERQTCGNQLASHSHRSDALVICQKFRPSAGITAKRVDPQAPGTTATQPHHRRRSQQTDPGYLHDVHFPITRRTPPQNTHTHTHTYPPVLLREDGRLRLLQPQPQCGPPRPGCPATKGDKHRNNHCRMSLQRRCGDCSRHTSHQRSHSSRQGTPIPAIGTSDTTNTGLMFV
jgi:hypothetical protein